MKREYIIRKENIRDKDSDSNWKERILENKKWLKKNGVKKIKPICKEAKKREIKDDCIVSFRHWIVNTGIFMP